jgi:hypothetical protein
MGQARAGTWRWLVVVATAVALGLPAVLPAEELSTRRSEARDVEVIAPSSEARTFGTASTTALVIGASEFDPLFSGTTWLYSGSALKTASDEMVAWVRLPAGAVVNSVQVEGCDLNAGTQMTFQLVRVHSPTGPVVPLTATASTGVSATPGCGFFSVTPLPAVSPVVIDNVNNTYLILVTTGAGTSFRAVRVYYNLQVSPAPGSATFGDVPTSHPFFQFVEALVASGITVGCGGGNYCPDAPLTRGQMAVFLSKALGLHFAP